MRFGSLFAGIGGLDLGMERAGLTCAWQVEQDPFCQSILAKHWPHVARYGDVREVGGELEPVDLVCGGFPCQPFSIAGDQRGADDDRNLWPEMLRVVEILRPRWVVGENVAALADSYLDTVADDLERAGYAVRAVVLPAAAFGLPQKRERLFVLAHSHGVGRETSEISNWISPESCRVESPQGIWSCRLGGADGRSYRAVPNAGICRITDGIPGRLDRYRVLGNAVVPAIGEWIGRVITSVDDRLTESLD